MGKEIADAWKMIDKGLFDLMSKNDELPPSALIIKSKRLIHLAKFCKTLSQRINERVREMPVGPIQPLFERYHLDRAEVDKQTN